MNGPFSEFWHLNGQTFLTPMYMPIFSPGYQWVAAVCWPKSLDPNPARPGSKAFALTAFCIQTLRTRDQRPRFRASPASLRRVIEQDTLILA